ncbi:hypothetical protein, partial [Corallococcus praedator]|uniref:hypothetical protein n=1 Tax=Corallococcus praedator TaxID=2316724 RepID=UPI001ABF247F
AYLSPNVIKENFRRLGKQTNYSSGSSCTSLDIDLGVDSVSKPAHCLCKINKFFKSLHFIHSMETFCTPVTDLTTRHLQGVTRIAGRYTGGFA